ncbi:MAG: hypothetical protein E3J72_02240 [Planctomycetota bacterium]|nr:MAG: hypothetical protein E3J72_02240 [Planctomycetota bacterium]
MRYFAIAVALVAVFLLATGGCSIFISDRGHGGGQVKVRVWSDRAHYPSTPPPTRVRLAAKRGYVIIEGYWEWRVNRWHWHAPRYESVRAGQIWVPGRQERVGGFIIWRPAHYKVSGSSGHRTPKRPSVPRARPKVPKVPKISIYKNRSRYPAPPSSYRRPSPRSGHIWIEGYYSWRGLQWTWHAGRWEKTRPGYIWTPGKSVKTSGRVKWVPGSWKAAGHRSTKKPKAPAPKKKVRKFRK